MKIIHKQQLFLCENILSLPIGSKIVCFKNQKDVMFLWYEFEQKNLLIKEERHFVVIKTGQPISLNYKYICTNIFYMDTLVWHLYEREKED